jgi:hypothetical protein
MRQARTLVTPARSPVESARKLAGALRSASAGSCRGGERACGQGTAGHSGGWRVSSAMAGLGSRGESGVSEPQNSNSQLADGPSRPRARQASRRTWGSLSSNRGRIDGTAIACAAAAPATAPLSAPTAPAGAGRTRPETTRPDRHRAAGSSRWLVTVPATQGTSAHPGPRSPLRRSLLRSSGRGRRRIRIVFPGEVLRRYCAGELDSHSVARMCGVCHAVALRELRRAGMAMRSRGRPRGARPAMSSARRAYWANS